MLALTCLALTLCALAPSAVALEGSPLVPEQMSLASRAAVLGERRSANRLVTGYLPVRLPVRATGLWALTRSCAGATARIHAAEARSISAAVTRLRP